MNQEAGSAFTWRHKSDFPITCASVLARAQFYDEAGHVPELELQRGRLCVHRDRKSMSHWTEITWLRSLIWRLGRKLYCAARRDTGNDPQHNGEYWLMDLAMAGAASDAVMLDVGANRGNWSARASNALVKKGITANIFAFEPAESTFNHLAVRFAKDSNVKPVRSAMSDRAGETEFYVIADLAGTNSLHAISGARKEKVIVSTVDDFLQKQELNQVLFVKTDTEGHDLSVLRGGLNSLREGRIDLWQFEYNHRWVANHAFLKDVFDLIEGLPYRFGKICADRIEVCKEWHPELERFFEANYVLVRHGSRSEGLCKVMQFNVSNVLEPA